MSVDRPDTRSIVAGSAVGLIAWVLGYVFTYLLTASDVRDSGLNRLIEALDGEPATYELVGWVFYNAHFVNTVIRDVPLFGDRTTEFIGGEDGFSILLYVVPVALLIAGGLAAARFDGAGTPTDGVLSGLTLLPGYLLPSVAGVFLFQVAVGSASGGPDLLPAIFLAGLIYPVLFAGLGGGLGGAFPSEG